MTTPARPPIPYLHDRHTQLSRVLQLFDIGEGAYIAELGRDGDTITACLVNVHGDYLLIVDIFTNEFAESHEQSRVEIRCVPRHRVLELKIGGNPFVPDRGAPTIVSVEAYIRLARVEGGTEDIRLRANTLAYSVGDDEIVDKILGPFLRRVLMWLADRDGSAE